MPTQVRQNMHFVEASEVTCSGWEWCQCTVFLTRHNCVQGVPVLDICIKTSVKKKM